MTNQTEVYEDARARYRRERTIWQRIKDWYRESWR